ncbi:MAG TPA: hypothetical protein VF992_05695 [Thermoplasmata archaeon]
MSLRVLTFIVAVASVTGLLLVPAHAAADAPVPVHEVGDAVGYGATTDLGAVAAPFLAQLRAYDAADDNFTINELDFTGTSDIWTTTKVVDKTTDTYTIQMDAAAGAKAHYVANVTSLQSPMAGTYPGDTSSGYCVPAIPPTTTATTSFEMQVDYLATSSGTSTWNISDFAERASRTNTSVDYRTTSTMYNAPRVDFNFTACTTTVTYESGQTTTTEDITTDLRMAYTPALDFFDFPIVDNETWYAFSNATLGGHIAGTIDVVGLSPEEEAQLLDSLNRSLTMSGFTVTGLDGFPIVLEDITIMLVATPYLKDGEIHDITVPVAFRLHARETKMTLADGNLHTVYLISETPVGGGGLFTSPCSYVYSPDDGFIVGFVCELAPGVSFFELKNTPPADAERHIADTKDTYSLAARAPNPIADFFLRAPYFGIVLIAAVAVVVAALLVRRRRKPTAVPPAAIPPAEMPPTGPPPPGAP